MSTTRRKFLSWLGGGAAAAAAPIACTRGDEERHAPPPSGRPPNVLLLVVDQERRWDLTFPLVPDELQPQLWDLLPAHRWLAENGIRFANHYASGIPCSPARSTIYTGFHAPDTQIIDVMEFQFVWQLGKYDPSNPRGSDSAMPTLGTVLASAPKPYYCAYKGKVHLALDWKVTSAQVLQERYGFRDWTHQNTAYYDAALAADRNEGRIAQEAVDWLTDMAPALGALDVPWLLAVNLINPHDVQYMRVPLPPGLPKAGLGTEDIPLHDPYFRWWNPRKPANFGPGAADADPRPQAIDAAAGILSVGFGNVPFDDDPVYQIFTAPHVTRRVPIWQAYLNYYINCILDSDAQLWAVIQALLASGADLANTWIVYLSDHGEMAVSQAGKSAVYNGVELSDGSLQPVRPQMTPLRSKTSLQFEEAAHVPLIFAAAPVKGSVLPADRRNTTVTALTSHVDIMPTLLELAGITAGTYTAKYGGYLSQLDPPLASALPGRSLAPILADPGAYRDSPRWRDASGRLRDSVLITGDAVNTIDPLWAWLLAFLIPSKIHFDIRGMMRAMVAVDDGGGLVKFGRWFSAYDYAPQATLAGSYALLTTPALPGYRGQDVQVFDLAADPFERRNIAATLPDARVAALSERLNALMAAEMKDPGRTPKQTACFLGRGSCLAWPGYGGD